MPICIECRYPVSTLYTTYSKADDKALGKGVRLTQCPRCKRFADKYVEHDFVVLFIDLVLIKPQPSILRLGILLLLFDVYLTWARIEKATPSSPSLPLSPPPPLPPFPSRFNDSLSVSNSTFDGEDPSNFLATQPIIIQYLFFLALCTIETASFHLPIRYLLSVELPRPFKATRDGSGVGGIIPHYPHPSLISTALLVSSFTKLFPLLLLVWQYDLPSSASAVSWAVIINNIAALEILLGCGYIRAALLCGVGALARAGIGLGILRAIGMGGGAAAAGVAASQQFLAFLTQVSGMTTQCMIPYGLLPSPALFFLRVSVHVCCRYFITQIAVFCLCSNSEIIVNERRYARSSPAQYHVHKRSVSSKHAPTFYRPIIVLRPQIAALWHDQRMPLRQKCDCPHEPAAPCGEDERAAPDTTDRIC
nr:protein arv1 [Quercus suber]